jgi:hypothetical protein
MLKPEKAPNWSTLCARFRILSGRRLTDMDNFARNSKRSIRHPSINGCSRRSVCGSTTAVCLSRREGKENDYATRAWRVSELWLSAKRSFARSLFFDMDRVRDDRPVVMPDSRTTTEPTALSVLTDGNRLDRKAFLDAVTRC